MSNLSIQLITCYAHLHYQIDVSMLILNKRMVYCCVADPDLISSLLITG